MVKQATRRIVKVFLASPSDLMKERDAAEEIVHKLNRMIGVRFGWELTLYRWEDQGPAAGRPQAIINPAVAECDLFVGLLWQRWGEATGAFTSGFEEEFEGAKKRWRETGEPEIWLVFKAPNDGMLNDPGTQLKQVLAFREKQQAQRDVLFREVEDLSDWKTKLHDWFLEHLFTLAFPKGYVLPSVDSESPSRPSPEVSLEAPSLSEDSPDVASPQLAELSALVASVVKSGRLEFSRQEPHLLSELDVARLFLLSSTWMARRYTFDFIGTHEINLLYKHRVQIEATAWEEYELLRTVLHAESDVIPGWFWFREVFVELERLKDTLFSMARMDADASLRSRALKVLRLSEIKLSNQELSLLPLSDQEDEVSAEALKYLGYAGDESALSLIETAIGEGSGHLSVFAAGEARCQILSRIGPKDAFSELVSNEQHCSAEAVGTLTGVADQLVLDDLIKGARSLNDAVKELSVAELKRRAEFSIELAEELKEDGSIDVRQLALQEIVEKRGFPELIKLRSAQKPHLGYFDLFRKKEPDLNLVAFNYFRTLAIEDLLQRVEWTSTDGWLAYKVLAIDHYETLSNYIRKDLEDGFERLRTQWIKELTDSIGQQKADEIVRGWGEKKLEEFIRSEFTQAALAGLEAHAEPSDAQIARRYLTNENQSIRASAVKILSRFGGPEDVQPLLDISEEAWPEFESLAPEAAIRLAPFPNKLAVEFADGGGRGRHDAGMRWLVGQDSTEAKVYFRRLLDDDSETKRLQGLQYLSKRMDREELTAILEGYPGEKKYFYNVVTWLDRLLYAPPALLEMFVRDLDKSVRIAAK
jgi:hypothetical protein